MKLLLPPELWQLIWEYEGHYFFLYKNIICAISCMGMRGNKQYGNRSLQMYTFLGRMYKICYYNHGIPPVFKILDFHMYKTLENTFDGMYLDTYYK